VRSFKTEKRKNKIISVISSQQHSLRMVLENIHDPHNVSAIFRTCDAAGVPKVSLLYNIEPFPKIGKKSSASAFKWVEKDKYTEAKTCFDELHKQGYKIYVSAINEDAKSLYKLDLTQKVAIVLGNEHRGISDEAAELADEKFQIPMFGMVQSLNVSVAAAIILYEAVRQRIKKGQYKHSELTEAELEKKIDEWCGK